MPLDVRSRPSGTPATALHVRTRPPRSAAQEAGRGPTRSDAHDATPVSSRTSRSGEGVCDISERDNSNLQDSGAEPVAARRPPFGRCGEEKGSRELSDGRFRDLHELLRKLSEYGSSHGLLDATPDVFHDLGFTASDIMWLESSGELAVVGPEQEPTRLDHRSIEADAVRRRRAIVVDAARSPDELEPRWIEAAFVAAPLIVDNVVVGVVRAASGEVLDETDCAVVLGVVDTLGHLIERNRAREQLTILKTALRELADSVTPNASSARRCDQASAAAQEWEQPETLGARATRTPRGALTQLTKRELETLAHLAAGDTNARIARQLVISEGTVKSHVKNILRKLGAANRAEAVSAWYRAASGSLAATKEHPNPVGPGTPRRPGTS